MPRLFRVFILVAVLGAAGCRTYPVVVAPPAPPDSADVYLAHYDYYHTSLVIPGAGNRGAVEYTYGDWDVLARDHRTGWTKFKAVVLPSRGALGRAAVRWDGASDPALLTALERCWKLSRYRVDARRLERLSATLDAAFDAATDRHGTTRRAGMDYAKAPRAYALFHNCNHALREWLIALGFDVPRRVALADFQTPGAVHTFAPGRDGGGMRTHFGELIGERPDPPAAP